MVELIVKRCNVPRGPTVPIAVARKWLDEHEAGASLDKLATKYRRDKRTLSSHIEKAKQQRAFDVAQQDRLKQALQAHQEDLLALMERIMNTVSVPDLEQWPGRVDFGLESLLSKAELSQEREVGLGETAWDLAPGKGRAVVVARSQEGPLGVKLSEEDLRPWDRLKQHLGARDPLWRELKRWKEALQAELAARAILNRAIVREIEASFSVPVLVAHTSQDPHFTHVFPPLVRAATIGKLLGSVSQGLIDRLRWSGNDLVEQRTSKTVGRFPGKQEAVLVKITALVEKITASTDAKEFSTAHRELVSRNNIVQGILEDYQSLHYVGGLCSACKKLAGL